MRFWRIFWNWLKGDNDKADEENSAKVQKWQDIREYNPLAIANAKLTAMICDEATFDIESDSKQAEPLKALVKDLQNKRYDFASMMNGLGGCFVTMAKDENGVPYHRVLKPDEVSIFAYNAEKPKELAMIIDRKIVKKKEYRLIRHHILQEGTLIVYYYTTDKNGNKEFLPEWESYKDKGVKYINANHIGVAYFKSPQDSRGREPIKGVPLNFGCEKQEEAIRIDRIAVAEEMELMRAKLFADKSITKAELNALDGKTGYTIKEKIYLIQKKAGIDGSLIDYYAPSTRLADYLTKLEKSYADWEDTVGLGRGFLTEAEPTSNATATEIKTANVKTRSYISKAQSNMGESVRDCVEMDSMFLNISKDLWNLKIDWYDCFEDTEAQYKRLANAVDRGIAEKDDELAWLFPQLTADERKEKLERIRNESRTDTDAEIERILNGGA